MALIIVIVIAVGMFAMNQAFAWYYKAQFLRGPCALCIDENPDWKAWYEASKKGYNLNEIVNDTAVTTDNRYNYSIPDELKK